MEKISKILRYIGLMVVIVSVICYLFMIIGDKLSSQQYTYILLYTWVPFSLLYSQVWHLTRNNNMNLENAIFAHIIAILYNIAILIFLFNQL